MASLEAIRDSQMNLVRAIFGAQGIDIDSDDDDKAQTVEDIRLRAMGLADNDLASQSGTLAAQEGFGIGFGLGYEVEQLDSS